MAFRYTPTPTPSISPTISLTPSITPSFTPTTTACPGTSPTPTPSITASPTITPTRATPTPTATFTPTPTRTPFTSYIYAGGASTWGSSGDACSNKACSRPYYKSAPTWAPLTIVYNDAALTSPFNGGGNWIVVDTSTGTFCSGLAWAAVQVDSSGVILNFVSCP